MAEAWKGDFHIAVGNKDASAMRRSVAAGLPVNEYVLGYKNEYTPLLYALNEHGGSAVVEVLIAAGAEVNKKVNDSYMQSPLCLAAWRGDLASVKALLAAGADATYSTEWGSTPLSHATGEKKPAHEAVTKTLLAAGAKPNSQALVWAARRGSPAMIDMLAAAGADLDEVSSWGTALIVAVAEKRVDTTEALLRLGADPNVRAPDSHRTYPGQTALDVAQAAKAKKLIPILEAVLAGKRPAAPAPKPLDEIPKLWKRIEKALKAAPAVKKSLKKGATEAQIAACEAALGATFPPDLLASYLIHDGQMTGAECLFPEEFANLDSGFLLLRLEEIGSQWKMWKGLADGGEFKKLKSQPDAGVRSDWWNAKWVPFAWDGGGDSLCVDLAPAKGGTAGQVILHQHADSGRSRKATSVQTLLQLLAEHLEEAAAE
jgi:cell wall assembly regulator SMI1/ankyrin repeat protein